MREAALSPTYPMRIYRDHGLKIRNFAAKAHIVCAKTCHHFANPPHAPRLSQPSCIASAPTRYQDGCIQYPRKKISYLILRTW